MKKLLLLTGVSAISIASMAADYPQPKELKDAFIYAISPNGQYAVSQAQAGVKIFNLATGQQDDYLNDNGGLYSVGIGKCVSNTGIVLGCTDYMSAEYWKDGEWYTLEVPDFAKETNLANAITPDGSRICGSIGVGGISFDGDALMQAPCIWNAEGDGYGMPTMLPYPERDFTGRIPQYVTAVDISDDGKTVVGQVMNATGMISYPILYKENENGEWTYEIPHENLLNPTGVEFPEFPGEGPNMPNYEDFMTPDEIAEYNISLQEYYDSGYTLPYPEIMDYMSEEELASYEAAIEIFDEENAVWYAAFEDWFNVFYLCMDNCPQYEFNSVRISPDGKTFGCTVMKPIDDPNSWFQTFNSNVWVFDINSKNITKYSQLSDLNLTYLGNNGIALASTSIGNKSNSFVLHEGQVDNMFYWMSVNCLGYATWMDENMSFEFTDYIINEETFEYEEVQVKELMSGRAVGTPDLSVIALTVENLGIWEDYMVEANAYVFNVKAYQVAGVENVLPADEKQTIYDLSGRKLKSATAPGIYIINGQKKVVR